MEQPIYITALASASSLGNSPEQVWEAYKNPNHNLSPKTVDIGTFWAGQLESETRMDLDEIRGSDPKYTRLDDTVLLALYVSRKAMAKAGWGTERHFGINLGSSRGATALFENYHQEFLEAGKAATLASPTTTLGNIASWVAHDLQCMGPEISHSITCSTALHALLNGVAWLKSGMVDTFMVGGSEAPLTAFTFAQMQALKIYSRFPAQHIGYPCRALDLEKKENGMVLGEGAAVACLDVKEGPASLAKIIGVGYATEILEHNISISSDAQCFQRSMKMALGGNALQSVDAVVLHAPGTLKGDSSEVAAIAQVFGEHKPALTSNKWKLGHTFGASGMLSMELAVMMLQHQEFVPVPFVENIRFPEKLDRVLVNAVGFGGNAVSVLLERV